MPLEKDYYRIGHGGRGIFRTAWGTQYIPSSCGDPCGGEDPAELAHTERTSLFHVTWQFLLKDLLMESQSSMNNICGSPGLGYRSLFSLILEHKKDVAVDNHRKPVLKVMIEPDRFQPVTYTVLAGPFKKGLLQPGAAPVFRCKIFHGPPCCLILRFGQKGLHPLQQFGAGSLHFGYRKLTKAILTAKGLLLGLSRMIHHDTSIVLSQLEELYFHLIWIL
jgi:hypothetical protein